MGATSIGGSLFEPPSFPEGMSTFLVFCVMAIAFPTIVILAVVLAGTFNRKRKTSHYAYEDEIQKQIDERNL